MRTRHSAWLLLALLTAAAPSRLAAQEGAESQQPQRCDIVRSGTIERTTEIGVPFIHFYDPFEIRCNDGAVLSASSGRYNQQAEEVELLGSVFFEDPGRTLTADQATYSAEIGRLFAEGNVVFNNRVEGSTLRGPELEYFRALPERPEAVVNAGQRPHLTMRPQEAAEGAEPLELDADRVQILGADQLTASGDVVIERTDLHATSGEARYDADTGFLELSRDAHVQSEEFDLTGEVIHAQLREGALEQIMARTGARLQGEELQVESPELWLFFSDELLNRAVARGGGGGEGEGSLQAVATAQGFRLQADSLDALLPGQQLEQVFAIGNARGEQTDTVAPPRAALPADSVLAAEVDSVGPDPAAAALPAADTAAADTAATADSVALAARALMDRDWIVGDTIIGFFERAEGDGTDRATGEQATDTTVTLRCLVARGSAQSLYRARDREGQPEGAAPGMNYLSGQVIELAFEGGELDVAEVTGLRRGLYLEPVPPAEPAPSDTTAAPEEAVGGENTPSATAEPWNR